MFNEHCKNINYEGKSELFQVLETQTEILKILNKTEKSVNFCSERAQDLISLDLNRKLKNLENKLDFLSCKKESPVLKELQKKVDKILSTQGNFSITEVITKITEKLEEKNKLLFELQNRVLEIERIVKTLEYDPDRPKPLEIETKNLAEQLLKVQSETVPLIEQIKPILETIKNKL